MIVRPYGSQDLRPILAFLASVVLLALSGLFEIGALWWAVVLLFALIGAGWFAIELASDIRLPAFKISLGPGAETTEPHQSQGLCLRTMGFFVQEARGERQENVLAYLVNLSDARSGWTTAFPRLTLLTENQFRENRRDGQINFRPKQPKRVLVCSLDETKPNSEIRLFYTNRELPNAVPRGDYIAEISIVGGRHPINARLHIWVDDAGQLRMAPYDQVSGQSA